MKAKPAKFRTLPGTPADQLRIALDEADKIDLVMQKELRGSKSATLKALHAVLNYLDAINIDSVVLARLRKALIDVASGHSHPLADLLEPSSSRPEDTRWRKAIQAGSVVAMDLIVASGQKDAEASKKIGNFLHKRGFRMSKEGKPVSDGTVLDWRRKLTKQPLDVEFAEEFKYFVDEYWPDDKRAMPTSEQFGRAADEVKLALEHLIRIF
jgi:hypothetical protein